MTPRTTLCVKRAAVLTVGPADGTQEVVDALVERLGGWAGPERRTVFELDAAVLDRCLWMLLGVTVRQCRHQGIRCGPAAHAHDSTG